MMIEMSSAMTAAIPALFILTLLVLVLYPGAGLRAKQKQRKAAAIRMSAPARGGFPTQRKPPAWRPEAASRRSGGSAPRNRRPARGQNWGQPPGKHQAMW